MPTLKLKDYNLDEDQRFKEIVVAGSHDAAITKGGGNAKTQSLNIAEQARAGIRVFDLRIAGQAQYAGLGGAKLKAFHADPALQVGTGKAGGMETTRLLAGTWGMKLKDILLQADNFIKGNTSEFLILKFDKCTNWPGIAAACSGMTKIFRGHLNLSEATLGDLKNSVIVLFEDDAYEALPNTDHVYIHAFKNLASGGQYESDYNGMQYYGKGGTSATKPSHYIQENINKQTQLMMDGKAHPDAIGMMYWTTTGVVGDIKKRNNKMWKKRSKMTELWQAGVGDWIDRRRPNSIVPSSQASAAACKRFLPNIVMVDFADLDKCKYIYQLNTLAATEIPGFMASDGETGEESI